MNKLCTVVYRMFFDVNMEKAFLESGVYIRLQLYLVFK